MSGYGGYQYNWLTDLSILVNDDVLNITHNKLKLTKSTSGWEYVAFLKIASYKNKSFKLNVHYETKTASCFLQNTEIRIRLEEGINVIPILDTSISINFSIYDGTVIEIELLPEYPDALIFDGVDDYGINENMPILTDYTVIVNRRYIETKRSSCLISKAAGIGKGAFIMELIEGDSNTTYNYSFDNLGRSKLYTSTEISWLNTTSYNGIRVGKGDGIDTNSIFMGAIRKGDSRRFKGAFYSAYLFDRSLDELEIKEFIRKYIDPEYLLPSEQTTE